MGIYDTTRMVGLGLGPLIGGLLYVSFGFAPVFLVAAVFAFMSVGLVLLLVREAPTVVAPRPRQAFFDSSLVNTGTVGLALAATLMAMIHATLTVLENELNLRLEQTALGFGIAFSALIFSRLVIQVPLGRLSDRIGRKPLIVGGLLLMAPATMLLIQAETTLQFTLLMIVQGIAMAAIASPAYALAADAAKLGREGQQMGMVTLGFGLGMAVGPFLAGSLAILAFELPFVLGGLATLFGAWYVRRFVPEAAAPRHDLAAEAP
jgi:MFS family permease